VGTVGDFGYGWTLSESNFQLRVDTGGYGQGSAGATTPFVSANSSGTGGTRVIITKPDGTVEGFTFYAQPDDNAYGAAYDYLPTFNRPNVHLVDTHGKGITEINEKGPVFEGKQYELDVLIYATGFEVQKTGIYNEITGEGGLELNDKYRDGIRTLVGIHSHGYPNLFIMGGYQSSFQFNLTDMLQAQGDHIAACIDYTRRRGYQTIDAAPEAEEWWVQECIANRGKTTRNQDCTPGYYNFEGEFNRRQDGNYNGGFNKYCTHMEEVRAKMEENFTFTKK
jgi:hypothetical protein